MVSQYLRRHGLKFSLVLPLLLTACFSTQASSPVYYNINSYNQPKIDLNVAGLQIINAVPPDNNPNSLAGQSPVSLIKVIEDMAKERLVPVGSGGQAQFIIKHAAVQTIQGTIVATAAVELDLTSGGGAGAGYVNIDAASLSFYPAGGPQAVRQAIYEVIQKLMNKMNVELTAEVNKKLSSWIVPGALGIGNQTQSPVQDFALRSFSGTPTTTYSATGPGVEVQSLTPPPASSK